MASLLSRLGRILRHRWMDESDSHRALPGDAVGRIEALVRASEDKHHGEIRVCVEAGLPLSYLWKDLTAHDRALMMFSKLRVWDTEANNGVLIYLLLAEQAIEVVADRGLSQKVAPEQWRGIVDGMREPFRQRRYEDGLNQAIAAVDRLLSVHFAAEPGQRNPDELPNRPLLR